MIRPALALALALAAACGDDAATPDAPVVLVDGPVIDAIPRETIMEQRSLQPTELAELILTGGPEDRVGIVMSAPFPKLEWNIHGHAGGGTQILVTEYDKMEVAYEFIPPGQADWYLLIRNGGQIDMTISIHVDLYGSVTARWQ